MDGIAVGADKPDEAIAALLDGDYPAVFALHCVENHLPLISLGLPIHVVAQLVRPAFTIETVNSIARRQTKHCCELTLLFRTSDCLTI